jgi:hypothetical protein
VDRQARDGRDQRVEDAVDRLADREQVHGRD